MINHDHDFYAHCNYTDYHNSYRKTIRLLHGGLLNEQLYLLLYKDQ